MVIPKVGTTLPEWHHQPFLLLDDEADFTNLRPLLSQRWVGRESLFGNGVWSAMFLYPGLQNPAYASIPNAYTITYRIIVEHRFC